MTVLIVQLPQQWHDARHSPHLHIHQHHLPFNLHHTHTLRHTLLHTLGVSYPNYSKHIGGILFNTFCGSLLPYLALKSRLFQGLKPPPFYLTYRPPVFIGVTLPKTNSSPLKITPWKRRFLLESIIFRGYVTLQLPKYKAIYRGSKSIHNYKSKTQGIVGCTLTNVPLWEISI